MSDQVEAVLKAAEKTRIIAILRGDMRDGALDAIQILFDGGIRVVEVTMNSPGVLATLAAAHQRFGDNLVMGAGTVTHVDQVLQVHDAGARFIVSPNTNTTVIGATRQRGMASFPGSLTCSEIVAALDAGANAVKLFPMVDASPNYVKAILAPLGKVRLIPTGGVTVSNGQDYLKAGAFALGVGSELVNANTFTPQGMQLLRKTTAELARMVNEFERSNKRP